MRHTLGLLAAAVGALSAAPALAQNTVGAGGHGGFPSTGFDPAPVRDNFRINPGREFKRGVAAFQARNYRSAVKILSRVTDEDPANADGWRILGAAYAAEGRWIASRSAYKFALRLKPDEIVSHAGLGLAQLQLKDPKAAQQAEWLKARSAACAGVCADAALLRELETRGPFAATAGG